MTEPLRIGIVLGSTRAGRFADRPAEWLLRIAEKREGVRFELVDLRDYPLPFFDEPKSPFREPSKNEVALRWARKVAQLDAFVFVMGEYNHSIPASLKNALDYLYAEFWVVVAMRAPLLALVTRQLTAGTAACCRLSSDSALQDWLRLFRGPNGDGVQLVEARCLGATCAMRGSRRRSSPRESTLLRLLDAKLLEEEKAICIGPILREHAVGDTQGIGPGEVDLPADRLWTRAWQTASVCSLGPPPDDQVIGIGDRPHFNGERQVRDDRADAADPTVERLAAANLVRPRAGQRSRVGDEVLGDDLVGHREVAVPQVLPGRRERCVAYVGHDGLFLV